MAQIDTDEFNEMVQDLAEAIKSAGDGPIEGYDGRYGGPPDGGAWKSFVDRLRAHGFGDKHVEAIKELARECAHQYDYAHGDPMSGADEAAAEAARKIDEALAIMFEPDPSENPHMRYKLEQEL